tara:strand:+ start:5117 stop:5383 length:267 start_codon:yes stop_codon:yes gene_type:complete
MVCIPENISNNIDLNNPNLYIFIDDKTKNNKIIYMLFDTYIPDNIVDYFELIGDKIAMINNNMCLSINLIEELRNYRYLSFYHETIKP